MRDCATTLMPEMTVTEHELLTAVLQDPIRTGLHMEIGTAAGGTLCRMLQSFPSAQRPHFVVVDPMNYFPNQLDAVVSNLRQHQIDPYQIDFRVMTSQAAFREAVQRQDQFDFILIDGNHKILSVMEDLKWLRLLNVGGVVCFHDFTPRYRGVWLAVQRLLAGWKNYEVLGQADSLLALRKTDPSKIPEVTLRDIWYARAWYLPLQVERRIMRFQTARKPARRAA